MINIIEKTHNGIERCLVIDTDDNKKILETTNGKLWNSPIYIVARRLDEYVESDVEKDHVEEQFLEQYVNNYY
jgi:hypothetical protein